MHDLSVPGTYPSHLWLPPLNTLRLFARGFAWAWSATLGECGTGHNGCQWQDNGRRAIQIDRPRRLDIEPLMDFPAFSLVQKAVATSRKLGEGRKSKTCVLGKLQAVIDVSLVGCWVICWGMPGWPDKCYLLPAITRLICTCAINTICCVDLPVPVRFVRTSSLYFSLCSLWAEQLWGHSLFVRPKKHIHVLHGGWSSRCYLSLGCGTLIFQQADTVFLGINDSKCDLKWFGLLHRECSWVIRLVHFRRNLAVSTQINPYHYISTYECESQITNFLLGFAVWCTLGRRGLVCGLAWLDC